MQDFYLQIRNWFRQNARELPWRQTNNPYKIWLSEIILQQTRVAQGINYYLKFIKTYPTVKELAEADEQEILKLWQGLGYYSRARNLHYAAKQVMDEFQGQFPSTYNDVLKLKGVGEYTAAAITSFAYNLPYPVLDGNAYRVLARYFNDSTPIDTSEGRKVFKKYITEVFDVSYPAEFNQAIMELGALVCTPLTPNCIICPLQESCLAFREGNPIDLPQKIQKVKIKHRFLHYLVCPAQLQLKKREKNDIWKNLYEFPMLEKENQKSDEEVRKDVWDAFGVQIRNKLCTDKHILSHQHLHTIFWEIDTAIVHPEILNIQLKDMEDFPIPRLIDRFLEENCKLFLK